MAGLRASSSRAPGARTVSLISLSLSAIAGKDTVLFHPGETWRTELIDKMIGRLPPRSGIIRGPPSPPRGGHLRTGAMAKEKHESEKEIQEKFFNRELSWLSFARRVLAMAGDADIPLMERVRFAGIVGMLHDEFSMKRLSGLKRRVEKGSRKISPGGSTAGELFQSVREELADQDAILSRIIQEELRPLLAAEGLPIVDYDELRREAQRSLRDYFERSVEPILTPLAVDAEHPFPFISNLGLNLAVILPEAKGKRERFVRVKVPDNRPRWVPFPDNSRLRPPRAGDRGEPGPDVPDRARAPCTASAPPAGPGERPTKRPSSPSRRPPASRVASSGRSPAS